MSETHGSITEAIIALGNQDHAAAAVLWERFFGRLCNYAETRIFQRHKRLLTADEIATDAFMALVDGVQNQRFDKVRNRDEMWQMLTLIAARETINAGKKLDRDKRGGGKVRGASAFGEAGVNSVADFVQREPTPEAYAEFRELSQNLLSSLPTDQLRSVAIWRMAGYSNAEIAEKLNCAERTIERKLQLIRKIWLELDHD